MGFARFNADGTLDTTFAGDGTPEIGFDPAAPRRRPSLSSPMAKSWSLELYRATKTSISCSRGMSPDGALDFTFSNDGLLTTGFGNNLDSAFAMAIQATDGRIVAAGNTGASGAGGDSRWRAITPSVAEMQTSPGWGRTGQIR